MKTNTLIATAKSIAYTRILANLKPKPPTQSNYPTGKEQPPIAIIADPMTWKNISQEHSAISLTPRGWKDVLMPSRKIRFMFCESAWSGTADACWRGQIYKDRRVFYENRLELLNILQICKSQNIPTVFWAKEDPSYFQDRIYDFTDTALKFDFILTTAEECIPRYHTLGHRNVYLWPFGFSPELYYPPKSMNTPKSKRSHKNENRENVAVFAGSWYADHPSRSRDLSDIFDMVLKAGIPLCIYDRHSRFGHSTKPFPAKYQPYVNDAVSYDALGDIYRSCEYVINVNTVTDSSTMFSRRVYEAMACGSIVISNESVGLRRQFGENLWYLGKNFDFAKTEQIRNENINKVFSSHTTLQRMKTLYDIVDNKVE